MGIFSSKPAEPPAAPTPEEKAIKYWNRVSSTVGPVVVKMVPLRVNTWVDQDGYAHFGGVWGDMKDGKPVFYGVHLGPGFEDNRYYDITKPQDKKSLQAIETIVTKTSGSCQNHPYCSATGCMKCHGFPAIYRDWFDDQGQSKVKYTDLALSEQAMKLIDIVRS